MTGWPSRKLSSPVVHPLWIATALASSQGEMLPSWMTSTFGRLSAAARQTCEHLGVGYHAFTTDSPLELVLFDFLRARMQRAKKVQRNVTRRSAAA